MNPVITALKEISDPEKAEKNKKFFQCFPGGYGEGDQFLGITVPVLRKITWLHRNIAENDIRDCIRSKYHEVRLTGIFLLVERYKKSGGKNSASPPEKWVNMYLENKGYVNNWDLVDSSAAQILGDYLRKKAASGKKESLDILTQLSRSPSLWDNRIAMIATQEFIRYGEFTATLELADVFLDHPHDLMHKATGWMLREIGNRDKISLDTYLKKTYKKMPRTMLRYAIEKFPEAERKAYLSGGI